VPSAISVENLTKLFGEVAAVGGISFEMGTDEFFSLVGPSGCGKTTTLRCIAGLETATSGRIDIGGATVYQAAAGGGAPNVLVPTYKRAIGMVFQNYAVWPHMTVEKNIAYPLKLRGVGRQEQKREVGRILEILGMEHLVARKPSQLSGGQQQRVALGRALIARPDVLLLDEPLSNLDAKLREQMRAELKRIQREVGVPILYVTHDQDEALSMSDRIAVMEGGRVHQIAAPTTIYERPATKFVLDFIGAVNYVPVQILRAEGTTVDVTLPDGQRLSVPRPERLPEGNQALLAVRPEDVAVTPGSVDSETEGGDASGVRVTVDLLSFRGNLVEYRLQADGYHLWMQTPKTTLIPEGHTLTVNVGRAYLLDGDAGTRLDAPVV